MDGTGSGEHRLEADVLRDLARVVGEAAGRIHAEHRRGATRWTALASLLTAVGTRSAAQRRGFTTLALALGALGSLAAAGHHRRVAQFVRSAP